MKTFLTEETGKPSLMRVANFIIICVTMINWSIACVFTKSLVALDSSTLTLVLGALGIKVGQDYVNGKKKPVPSNIGG